MEDNLQNVHFVFTIHNLSMFFLTTYLIFNNSVYIVWWHEAGCYLGDKMVGGSWEYIMACIVMAISIVSVTIWALCLQILYAYQGQVSLDRMKRLFRASVITHLEFIAGPLLIKYVLKVQDPTFITVEVWSSVNFLLAILSL